MATRFQTVSELAASTTARITNGGRAWMDFLTSAARMYKYDYRDQVLIYAQKPDATACIEMERWNRRFHRWVKGGTKSIALLNANGDGLRHVFDVSDTRPGKGGREPYVWQMREEHSAPVLSALGKRYGVGEAGLAESLMTAAAAAVREDYRDHLKTLMYAKEGSFLEELDSLNTGVVLRDTLTASVQYMVLARCGLDPDDYLEPVDFCHVPEFSTTAALACLGDATAEVSRAVLQEVERAVKAAERQQEKNVRPPLANAEEMGYIEFSKLKRESETERSATHGDTGIHPDRGIPRAQPDLEGAVPGGHREVRAAAPDLPQGAPQGALHRDAAERDPDGAPAGGQPHLSGAVERAGAADGPGAGGERGVEGQGPDGLGAADEQHPALGGGDGAGGAGLPGGAGQLTLFPSQAEQMEQIAAAEDEKSSAFVLPQEEINRVLCLGSSYQNGKFRIQERLSQAHLAKDNVRFLRDEYKTSGCDFTLSDGSPGHVWYDRRGVGISVHGFDHQNPDVLLTWTTVEQQLRALVQSGRYLSPEEREQYAAWVKARQAAALQAAQAALDHRPTAPQAAVGADGQLTLEGLLGGWAVQREQDTRDRAQRITQEDIDALLLEDWNIPGRKLRIFKEFQSGKSDAELADYLRSIYNVHGYGGPQKEGPCTLAHGEKGFVYYVAIGMRVENRENDGWREVSYEEMVGHIRALIDAGRYLDAQREQPAPVQEETPEKEYDLGFGYLGNGPTVWNRLEMVDHDFRTVAHIGADGAVVIYDKEMPQAVQEQIRREARQLVAEKEPQRNKLSPKTIEEALCAGTGIGFSKFRILAQFQKGQSAEENAAFLQQEYGSGERTLGFSNGGGGWLEHNASNLVVIRGGSDSELRAVLTWGEVEQALRSIIDADRYLDARERERYQRWLTQQEQSHLPGGPEPSEPVLPTALYREALPMLLHGVQASEVYPLLRDRDTTPQEAEAHILETLDGLAEGWKERQPALFDAYHRLPSFREWLAEDIFQQTYEDLPAQGRDEIERHAADPDAPAWVRPSVPEQAAKLLEERGFVVSGELLDFALSQLPGDAGADALADKAEEILRADEAETALPSGEPPAIPIDAELTLEGRTFTVESINETAGTVDLRDAALYATGIPIFRTEPIERVRLLLESPEGHTGAVRDIREAHQEAALADINPHLRDVLREGLFYRNEGKSKVNHYLDDHPDGPELAAFLADRFTGTEDGLTFSDGQAGGFKAHESGLEVWTPLRSHLYPWEEVAGAVRQLYRQQVHSFGPVEEDYLDVDADAIRRGLQDPERQAAFDKMFQESIAFITNTERALAEDVPEDDGQITFDALTTAPDAPVSREQPPTPPQREDAGGVKLRSIVLDLTGRGTTPPIDPEWTPVEGGGSRTEVIFTIGGDAPQNARPRQERHDYHITDDALGEGGPKAKFRANVAAIRLLKEIEGAGRLATPEEQEVMAHYVGWGGLPDAFRDDKPEWGKEYAELKELLTDEEYRSAKGSTLNAHYTTPTVIKAMYEAVERMGFKTGNILEPACGVGNFLGLVPEALRGSKLYGVELDSITGRLAAQLYQNANITVSGFEKTAFPDDFFDLAISNVPFGEYKVADRRYDKHNLLIHDYFFAKSLDKVRPGGLVAFITSNGTLDKQNPAVRRLLAQKADLLGAVRLPNNAFKRNAGTEVTADILFFQKRDRAPEVEPDWVNLAATPDGVPVNRYFADHPEMMLGTMRFDKSMYGDEKDTTCEPIPGADLAAQLADAMQRLQMPDRDLLELTAETEEQEAARAAIPADPSIRNFSYALVDGELYFRENSMMSPVEVGKTPAARIKGLIELRDCTRKLIDLQMENADAYDIQREQQRLGRLYDSFTAKYGLISSIGNKQAFEQDSSYCLLCSLEVLDDEGRLERKADMFTKRTIQRAQAVTSVDTATEALAVSIGEKACVDLGYMAQLLGGRSPAGGPEKIEQVVQDLKGIIFKDPATGPFDFDGQWYAGWQTADEYLSGNVRQKLAAAREAAAQYPEFAVNVEMLEQVQPKDLTAAEIDVQLGTDWIDPHYYQQFMVELLHTPRSIRGSKTAVEHSPHTHEWHVKGKLADSITNSLVYATYGTKRRNAYTILEDTLNLRDSRVYDTTTDAEGKEKRVLNGKETALAQQRQEAMKEAFKAWIWKDPQRRQELCAKYNTVFNAIRPREYDGSHIRFNGMNPEISLRTHQLNAVAHILYGKNALLAHCVGAGKTYEMVAAAMESRRLGLCGKSLFVVPNHLTEQWGSEFLQLYPGANVLVATKKDFEPQNRKKFCSRIATGDFDAIVIGHSQFEKIPLSVGRQRALLNQQIDEIVDGIAEAKEEDGERYTIKQLERTRKNLEAKLEKLEAAAKKDSVVTFEELGVDRLFVDEAHNYKNLFTYTKMRNVAGIGQADAQKSSDMYAKCRYMDELTGGRGVTFATGTPISNSMVELYTMMRYLQADTLERVGQEHFDSWASAFGEKVTAIELNPTGTGFRAKTRFARFHNLPELLSLWKEAADIQTADMLHLPVPEAEYINVVTKPTEHQKQMVVELGERAEAVHKQEVEPYQDNMLKITSDGRKLALDQRLANELLPDDPDSKVNAAIQNILQVWRDSADTKGAQLVFSDLSTPHYDGAFNIYDDIKNKLMAQGVPAGEIAFIHDAKTEAQKAELFAKVRKGQVRVLLGSTSKMGAGTNVQDRLVALHHLDCPWRPADIEQREGRILRQGNKNKKVKIFKYVTEGTFDAYNWSIVEAKQKFIGQIMTSKSPARSCDDVDETALSYAEVKALATGDPRIKEKTELETAVTKLKLLKANHDGQRYEMEDRLIKYFPQAIQRAREQVKGLEADLAVYRAHPAQGDTFHMVVQGRAYAERKDAGAAILAACKRMTDPEERVPLGEYRGFPMTLWIDNKAEKFMVSLKAGDGLTHTAELGADEVGNVARINNALDIMEKSLAGQRDHLETLTAQMETTREEAARPFPQEEELNAKSARLAVLNVELNMDRGGDAPVTDEAGPVEPDGKQSVRRMLKELEPAAPPQGGAPREREMGVAI